jgi:hypothetical protein
VFWQGLDLDFTGVVFDGGDFTGAEFSSGRVRFDGARFSGGEVSFYDAEFSDGVVSFVGAEFSGGTVDFTRVGTWSHPPAFDWDGKPPLGVILPPTVGSAPRQFGLTAASCLREALLP